MSHTFPRFMPYLILLILNSCSNRQPSESGIQGDRIQLSPPKSDSVNLTIMVPKDIEAYKTAMTNYINDGGSNPARTWTFIPKQIIVAHTDDPLKASADSAAAIIKPGGGPPKAFVSNLTLSHDTAYVVLNIDEDGWAGVSYSTSKIHPLVEQTLLHSGKVKTVIFGRAERLH